MLLAVTTIGAQQPRFADLIFEPNRSGDKARSCCVLRPGEITGHGVTVRQIIEAAYRRHAFDRREVIGGPAWIDEDRFDFTAIITGDHIYDRDGFPGATFAIMRAHVNEHARIRLEQRERPVYALVAAGTTRPGLTASTTDCAAQMRALTNRQPISGPPCGASPYPGRLMARGVGMADIANLISRWVDRPVIDRTGLTGVFDLDLEGVEVKPAGPFGPSQRPSETTRSIFDHIQQQLGMRLEPVTAPVEVVIVEDVDRPSRPPIE
jgi:uncharacterized protein (TIGR03435 family)